MIAVIGKDFGLIVILTAPYSDVQGEAIGDRNGGLPLKSPPFLGNIIDMQVCRQCVSAQQFNKSDPVRVALQRDFNRRNGFHARLINGRASREKQNQFPHRRKLLNP